MKTMTVEQLYEKLCSKAFQDPRNGDLHYNYFMFQYDATKEYDMLRQIDDIREKIRRPNNNVDILLLDLFEEFTSFLDGRSFGRKWSSYKEYLINMMKNLGVENQFQFAGFLDDHNDVYRIAASARLLALPTLDDCQPNSIREAMFMRLPVISTKVGGIPNLNAHNQCLHLVDRGDIEALADGIHKLLNDKEYATNLINNAYEEMMNYFAPGKIYSQMIETYKDICRQEN